MKTPQIRTALFVGLVAIIVLLCVFFQDPGSSFWSTFAKSAVVGVLGGIVIAFVTRRIRSSRFEQETAQLQLQPKETILFETLANHFNGIDGRGGKLSLTTDRLVFRPYGLKPEAPPLSVQRNAIATATRYRYSGLVNKGLRVTLTDGQTRKFVVDKAAEWIKRLN